MRIATNLFYDRASSAMGALTARGEALQTQIATGKRLTAPSSDAAAYRQLAGIRRAATDQVQDAANVTLAQSLLSASDTALAAIETQLQRASELAIQGSSGTLSAVQRETIASELDAIVEDLMKLANSTDSRGSPLFSGAGEAAPYVKANDGTIGYTGSGEAGAIPIGGGSTIHATTSGARIFGNIDAAAGGTSDMFAILQGLSTTLRSGGNTTAAITDVKTTLGSVGDARASLGARAARLELESDRLGEVAVTREITRSALEDTDVTAAITELQKTLTVLQATQASFSKLSSLSLFNYLR